MIWIISFLALVASTLGCGVRQMERHLAGEIDKRSISAARALSSVRDLPNVPNVVGGGPAGIIHGNEAHSWPWQVSIQTSRGQQFCGGTLISKNWILTAAHCSVQPRNDYVVLGQYDRGSNNEDIQVKKISKVITHPDYKKQTKYNNDVALLKLSSPVQMTSRISPICLSSSLTSIRPGTLCVTTGWGATETVSNPRILQEATVPIVSQAQCRQFWHRISITDAMICAGASGASSCQGDSGGPLMCESSGVWYQVGIVSWGHESCSTDRPVVYTRVSYFRQWINEIIRFS
ncbi:chymotrypsin-like protease CTRL-1 isoform X1 [Sinocyclocheilus rhinocerous]|uniref:chymotrypsin-like protease CTRL-1 isoform X1 n=1 Tax=Sinocyclocheilus rhinocerous TaxID=307959 RepID=UPI0007B974F9|nr:PREDICTED: chymotrypsin-like protease CTRL-1 isoform X1 [Sinocyclocheilus rhinocerous]